MNRLSGSVSALALATLVSFTTLPAAAQEVIELDTITVFAGIEEVAPLRTGVAVDVITEEELEETGEARVVDFLARQPGISLRSTGGLGSFSGVTIRGVSQNNIAVRVDGIDVADPTGPQVAFDFGSLLTSDISRIEILRGSQSAVFGSEAVGGVINITTKRAEKDGLSVSAALEAGSYDTRRASLTLANRGAGHDTAVTLAYTRSDGFSIAEEDDGNTEADGYEARRLSFAGSYEIGQDVTLDLSGFVEDATFDYDEESGGTVFDGTPDDTSTRDQKGLRAALRFDTGMVENELYASTFRIERNLTGTNAFGSFDFLYEGRRDTLGYRGGLDINTQTRLAFGLERVTESYGDVINTNGTFGPFTSFQDHDTTVNAVFAELSYAPNSDIDLSFALRHDDHSEHGGFTTGRVSGVWRMRDDLVLRANLGTGFRAPSNYELYAAFAGNPDLEPETSKSFDLGIEKTWENGGYLRATAFWLQAEDIIDYSFSSFSYVQRDGTSTRRGIELAGSFPVGERVTVDASYTLTDTFSDVTLDSSSWSLSTPRHALSATVSADLTERMNLAVTGLYQADRPSLDDFGVVNATATYKVTDKADAYLRVENLFDADYQTVPGYGQSDRAAYFGIRASF